MSDNTSWMDQANCRGMDAEIFFPEVTGPHNAARAQHICAACPVQKECRDYGDQTHSTGIWGGIARGEYGRRIGASKPLQPCGTEAAYWRHVRHGEKPCRPCTLAASRANYERIKNRSGRRRCTA